MNEIIPGILAASLDEIEKKIERVRPFATTLHIDLMDGSFAQNTTYLDPTSFAKYSQDFFLEVHMMVDDPLSYLKPFADAGFKRFMGHVEKMKNVEEFVSQGQLSGEVGLYLDGPTPLESITVPLEDLDSIGIFTAKKVGFSGQPFEQETLKKIQAIRGKNILNARGLPLAIEVDGGINEKTLLLAKEAGASRFVCSSALFAKENIQQAFNSLQKLQYSSQ